MAGRRPHSGLTLVEVLLVLALLVVITAVAAPLMQGTFSRASLQNSGDLVRAAWSRARLASMETGQAHIFRFEVAGSRYIIRTLDALGTAEADPAIPVDDTARDASDLIRTGEDRLPDGIVFAGANIAASSQVEATLGPIPAGAWSAPIVFRPDGTTTDASVLLANDDQQTVRVTLRGMTGISNASEVGREPLPPK